MTTTPTTFIKSLTKPDMTQVLQSVKEDVKISFNCVNLGTIEAFDAATQLASISLNLKMVIGVKPDGTEILQDHQPILDCPVHTLFGGSSFLSMPITVGDTCIVLFNDREIDNWVSDGGTPVPTTSRKHDISDAIALVGIRSLQNSIQDYLLNGIRLMFSANSKIDLTDNAIHSLAELFTQTGDMLIDGSLTLTGVMRGNTGSGNITMDSNLVQTAGKSIHAGNGATGTYNIVTVVDGIVVSGS